MQTYRKTIYRCILSLAGGVLFYIAWLSLISLLIVQGVIPMSLAAVLSRCGCGLTAILIGFLTYDIKKSIWRPLASIVGFMLVQLTVGLACGGLDGSELWKDALFVFCGMLVCVLLKNKGVGKSKKGKAYGHQNRKKAKNATR